MFGFSFPKIIVLLLIIFVIWQIFKIIERKKKLKEESKIDNKDQNESYEPLIECSKCGNFYSNKKSEECPVCGTKN